MVVFGKGGIKKKTPGRFIFLINKDTQKIRKGCFFIVTQSNNEKVFKISWIKCAVYISGK